MLLHYIVAARVNVYTHVHTCQAPRCVMDIGTLMPRVFIMSLTCNYLLTFHIKQILRTLFSAVYSVISCLFSMKYIRIYVCMY